MGSNIVAIKTALLSVSDKTDLEAFARHLCSHGTSIISTGGTARVLTNAGIDVTPIQEVTTFPEMMDGRVKTLHPKVHGGLLALRDRPGHLAAMQEHGINAIDLVCINLYPFEQTIADATVTDDEAIEQIDIGGPALIRSAAKNHRFVTCVTNPDQYDRVCQNMDDNNGGTGQALRCHLATTAFARTSEYDRAITTWMKTRWLSAPLVKES